MRRPTVSLIVVVLLCSVVVLDRAPVDAAAKAAANAVVDYERPVAGRVLDPFRPPATRYGSGNRGVVFRTTVGQSVRAAGDGVVTFAGDVAGSLHVVIAHADGVKTTYSFLSTIELVVGQRVRQGQSVGTAYASVHISVRFNGYYLDPLVLFDGDEIATTRLLALTPDVPGFDTDDGFSIGSIVGGVWKASIEDITALVKAGQMTASTLAGLAVWVADMTYRGVVEPSLQLLQIQLELAALALAHPDAISQAFLTADILRDVARGEQCTEASVPAPRVNESGRGRHIVVQVAGFGSSATSDDDRGASAFKFDTQGLGYDDADVVRFSYAGGSTADSTYTSMDSTQDLDISAQRLFDLLATLRAANPDAQIDVVGHSQGGVVARDAVTRTGAEALKVNSVTTVGSPHQGSSVALVTIADPTLGGEIFLRGVGGAKGLNPHGAAQQLTPGSDYLHQLNNRQIPEGVWFTSVAGRGDVVVTPPDTVIEGANNVTLGVAAKPGGVHTALVQDPQVTNEILRAINRQLPTCRSSGQRMLDSVRGRGGQALMRLVGITGAGVVASASPLPDPTRVNGTTP
jgi:triacylglycerol esterase/lipase EstA (alpha/beta hydrolase family)